MCQKYQKLISLDLQLELIKAYSQHSLVCEKIVTLNKIYKIFARPSSNRDISSFHLQSTPLTPKSSPVNADDE